MPSAVKVLDGRSVAGDTLAPAAGPRQRERKSPERSSRAGIVRWKVAMVCLLLVVGCTPRPDVTASDSDNGGHIQVRSGQILDIVLADDYARSHCQWYDEQEYDFAILEPLGQIYEPARILHGAAAPGANTSRYKAAAAGTVRVTLAQEYKGHHVAKRFALDVTVH